MFKLVACEKIAKKSLCVDVFLSASIIISLYMS